ncbi:MAG: hypothetical protein CM1200mP2_03550 [Planctomycetaceae bacterium]|nr:MAG: hypothetical protein CM1200mP2_03550 [Planctomycetaceae bacterium]
MSKPNPLTVDVRYGRSGRLALSVDADRLVTRREAPEQLETLESSIRAALTTPLDFPPLEQAVIPGDRIVIALDADTPAADRILAAIWDVLALRGRRTRRRAGAATAEFTARGAGRSPLGFDQECRQGPGLVANPRSRRGRRGGSTWPRRRPESECTWPPS